MINHARTLLLNITGTTNAEPHGWEYVPADYSALTLTSYLSSVRAVLFGRSPDSLFRNYRLRQYMTVLHSTELVEFVTNLDSRITYDPFADSELFDDVFNTTVSIVTDPGGTGLLPVLTGVARPDDRSGKSTSSWRVAASSDEVEIIRRTPSAFTVTVECDTSSGLSAAIQLPGSDLYFKVPAGTSGMVWTIESRARPELDLGSIVAQLESIGEDVILELFGVGTPLPTTEPFKTFSNLWKSHDVMAYKLGGLLLAYIYRMEQIRQASATDE